MGVAQEDHDALLVEVQRLEAELGRVRQDLQGVLGCKGKCGQLDTLQQTVSNADVNSCLGFGVISTVLYSLDFCFAFPDIRSGVLPGA